MEYPERPELSPRSCITLMGMAGAGKTTVGQALALELDWVHMDTDRLIEAHWGRPLQYVYDGMGREAFIKAEENLVAGLDLCRTVISTGGSVVYGPRAVSRLRTLGPVIYLRPDVETVTRRVADAEGRGLCIAPGQTVADLYAERLPLYEASADLTLDSGRLSPRECALAVRSWLFPPGVKIP